MNDLTDIVTQLLFASVVWRETDVSAGITKQKDRNVCPTYQMLTSRKFTTHTLMGGLSRSDVGQNRTLMAGWPGDAIW